MKSIGAFGEVGVVGLVGLAARAAAAAAAREPPPPRSDVVRGRGSGEKGPTVVGLPPPRRRKGVDGEVGGNGEAARGESGRTMMPEETNREEQLMCDSKELDAAARTLRKQPRAHRNVVPSP